MRQGIIMVCYTLHLLLCFTEDTGYLCISLVDLCRVLALFGFGGYLRDGGNMFCWGNVGVIGVFGKVVWVEGEGARGRGGEGARG
ncbi:hypothetical protein K458DRAFT_166912 [Lentithecium fluviatile CBS 122367]|uniref:Uncharacterized protein n=1 Tax=Lentithecium fluviatile CBS 122367 TaxID=1168545 RepID=A0A6G1IFT5_9PLEO|nr:hypothetical protein K458DRAFT_166912 [Lentithecium fluviatile CBS 122367]